MKALDNALKAAAITTWVLTFAQLIVLAFIKIKYSIDVADASSVGIIGGADGPTAIFISSNTTGFRYIFLILCPFIAVGSTVVLFVRRYRRNRAA